MTDKVLSDLRRIAQTYPTRGTQDAVIAAVDEIQRLRSDLAAARADLKAFANSESTSAQQLRADLAAAQALLREVRCCTADWNVSKELETRIRAALAGEGKT